MEEKIKELKRRFYSAEQSDLALIDKEMEALASENPEEFAKAMLDAARETAEEAHKLLIRQKLEKVLPIVSVSYLAKTYFDKTPQWFYQRLNGNIVNGKPAAFSTDELKKLTFALEDIGNKLKQSASLL
jgi:hypothetical protein